MVWVAPALLAARARTFARRVVLFLNANKIAKIATWSRWAKKARTQLVQSSNTFVGGRILSRSGRCSGLVRAHRRRQFSIVGDEHIDFLRLFDRFGLFSGIVNGFFDGRDDLFGRIVGG